MVSKDSLETNVTFMQLDAKGTNPRGGNNLGPTWTLELQILNCMHILGNLMGHSKVRVACEDMDSRFTKF